MRVVFVTEEVGQRLREIRSWRQLSIRTVADLSGISYGYLAKIERGERAISNRRVLDALATTLRVSPAELTGRPYAPVDPIGSEAQAALGALEAALNEWWPGEVPDDGPPRPWPEVCADLRQLTEHLRPQSDYAGQGAILPSLLHDLLIHVADSGHRAAALRGLIASYHAAGNLAARLGARHLGYVAAERVQAAAEALDEPEWLGLSAWTRAQFVSALSRRRQYALAVAGTEVPSAGLESRGMSHLTAALAAAALGDGDTATAHLDEAEDMARSLGLANSTWGGGTMNFGKTNVGIWRISIGVELGQGARVAEAARKVDWQAIPTSRQGAFWIDLGRGMIQEKKSRHEGLKAILKAEELTPQQVRNNAFVRGAVSSLLTTAHRNAGGRELRGLAWRMGVAPTG
jgi:transcriptional regulator with XRE-family HTH domain